MAAIPGRASASAQGGGRRHFPNVTLLTQDNQPVRFYDDLVKDKIVMFNFFYVSCTGICPASTSNLVKVQHLLGNRVGRDIFMYSISLKPREDRPAQLKEYQEMHGIKAGWTLLTGKPDRFAPQLEAVAREARYAGWLEAVARAKLHTVRDTAPRAP